MGDLGVCHADERFIMHKHGRFTKTDRDLEMSAKMVKLWTDIAEGRPMPSKWLPGQGNASMVDYAILDLGDIRMGRREETVKERWLRNLAKENLVHLRKLRVGNRPKIFHGSVDCEL